MRRCAALAAGKIRTDEEEQTRKRIDSGEGGCSVFDDSGWKRTEEQRTICKGIEKGRQGGRREAHHLWCVHTSFKSPILFFIFQLILCLVAIAWCMQKAPYVLPIIGGRKVEHFQANLEALEISLSSEHIAYLDGLTGFPCSVFVRIFIFFACYSRKVLAAVHRETDRNTFASSRRRDTLIGGPMRRLSALASRLRSSGVYGSDGLCTRVHLYVNVKFECVVPS